MIKIFNIKNTEYIKSLFIIGFLLQIVAQVVFSLTDKINLLKPIDFIHWTILLGIVLIIPGILRFSNGSFSKIGTPLTIAGIIFFIGMCILDFIRRNMPNQEMRNEFAGYLSQFPTIWKPFISKGPSFLNIGILLLSLNYIRQNKLGVILVLIAALFIFGIIPTPSKMIFGYFTTLIGFGVLFLKKIQANEYKD